MSTVFRRDAERHDQGKTKRRFPSLKSSQRLSCAARASAIFLPLAMSGRLAWELLGPRAPQRTTDGKTEVNDRSSRLFKSQKIARAHSRTDRGRCGARMKMMIQVPGTGTGTYIHREIDDQDDRTKIKSNKE